MELIYDGGNLFKPTGTLTVRATQSIRAGGLLEMDYDPQKSDSQVALDYGIIDPVNLNVRAFPHRHFY